MFLLLSPCGILGQMWHFIVSIPDLCELSYFALSSLMALGINLFFRNKPLCFGAGKELALSLLTVVCWRWKGTCSFIIDRCVSVL